MIKTRSVLTMLTLGLCLVALGSAVLARDELASTLLTEYIENGGFETGDFSDWSTTTECEPVIDDHAHSGSHSGKLEACEDGWVPTVTVEQIHLNALQSTSSFWQVPDFPDDATAATFSFWYDLQSDEVLEEWDLFTAGVGYEGCYVTVVERDGSEP